MIIFYDIEIFKHDALVVFKDIDKKVIAVYHNDFAGIDDMIKGNTLVGYNNYHYDDYILTKMVKGWKPEQLKELSNRIITNMKFVKEIDARIYSLDTFQQIDVNNPSLKKIEGNMGRMILESDVPFNIDRALTDEEYQEVVRYCSYDVDTTIEIYKLRQAYFTTKKMLVDKLGMPKAMRWKTTTIAANLLLKEKSLRWGSLRVPEHMYDKVSSTVSDMWLKSNPYDDASVKRSVTLNEFGNNIQFGFGGLHGAPTKPVRARNVILLDVQSMYPNVIVLLKALGAATKEYKQILEKRVKIKHTDKLESDALKLVLNSVYGNLNNKYSLLYNPRAAMSVCVYGQIVLYDLCKRLALSCRIININTDGVAFTTSSDDYKVVAREWEQDYGLTLEQDGFDLFIQKDVNNYIGVKGDDIKCKGGDVNKYNRDNYFANNNARIIDVALVDKLVYGVDTLVSIMKHENEPYLYQYILKAGKIFHGTSDTSGNKYNNVNRVFASKYGDTCLQKKRPKGGYVKFANAPDKMLVWNDDCDNVEDFKKMIDIDHYYKVVMKKLAMWEE